MLESFVTDKYRVLKAIYEHQVEIADNTYSPLSQQEIGDILGFSKVKANTLIKELIEEGYIEAASRSKYRITEDGLEIFKKIKV